MRSRIELRVFGSKDKTIRRNIKVVGPTKRLNRRLQSAIFERIRQLGELVLVAFLLERAEEDGIAVLGYVVVPVADKGRRVQTATGTRLLGFLWVEQLAVRVGFACDCDAVGAVAG